MSKAPKPPSSGVGFGGGKGWQKAIMGSARAIRKAILRIILFDKDFF